MKFQTKNTLRKNVRLGQRPFVRVVKKIRHDSAEPVSDDDLTITALAGHTGAISGDIRKILTCPFQRARRCYSVTRILKLTSVVVTGHIICIVVHKFCFPSLSFD